MPRPIEDVDRDLAAAHVRHGRALQRLLAEDSAELHDEVTRSWEEVQHVGEEYLHTRLEHDTRAAGVWVDPAAFENPT